MRHRLLNSPAYPENQCQKTCGSFNQKSSSSNRCLSSKPAFSWSQPWLFLLPPSFHLIPTKAGTVDLAPVKTLTLLSAAGRVICARTLSTKT
ncbi:hypothetical protein L596_023066 [Steinernema carpocapsae]|uniref:Uncharacterized protein n=1 Tax=Steinernema carpocapsae TaxID=34508 RepID=A0A4U5MCJ5_STECR|nr:hypothetical protein L596_023066 [Steinernema carpocapsae]